MRSWERQIIKFDRIARQQETRGDKERGRVRNTIDKSKWVINISSWKLNDVERAVLQKGLNFAQSIGTPPKADIIAGIEPALRNCEDQERDERTRSSIVSLIRNHRPKEPNTTTKERSIKRNWRATKTWPSFQWTKETRQLYWTPQHTLRKPTLGNPPFKQITKNPTSRNEKRVNETLKNYRPFG